MMNRGHPYLQSPSTRPRALSAQREEPLPDAQRSADADGHVRRSGVYETGSNSIAYEARIGGRTSLLETTDTTFSTTGAFSMWAQRTPNDEEIVSPSGRVREIPAYVEWTLADDLLDLARQRTGGQSTARRMLDDLILDWEIQWRHEDTEVADVEAGEGP